MLTTGDVDRLAAAHVGYLLAFLVVGTVVAVRLHRRALLR
jgi:hypothetical protein